MRKAYNRWITCFSGMGNKQDSKKYCQNNPNCYTGTPGFAPNNKFIKKKKKGGEELIIDYGDGFILLVFLHSLS